MSAAPKKKDEPILEVVDLSTDREQGLSKNFEDPVLEELIPGLVQPVSITEEAAQAVQELVQEASPIPENEPLPIPDSEPSLDLSGSFSQESQSESEPVERTIINTADFTQVKAPAATGAAKGKIPSALPKTVSPNEKVERSLLMQLPNDALEETRLPIFEGRSLFSLDPRLLMAEKLFEMVLCEQGFERLVQDCLEAIMTALKAQAGSVLELDHEREDFFFRASLGGASSLENLKAFRVPITKGIVGRVAETGQALLLRDLEKDELQMRAISAGVGFEAKTCMAAPILVGGQAYGVIEVFNKLDGGLYDEADLKSLEDAVKMLAKVLEVRFLTAELVKRVR